MSLSSVNLQISPPKTPGSAIREGRCLTCGRPTEQNEYPQTYTVLYCDSACSRLRAYNLDQTIKRRFPMTSSKLYQGVCNEKATLPPKKQESNKVRMKVIRPDRRCTSVLATLLDKKRIELHLFQYEFVSLLGVTIPTYLAIIRGTICNKTTVTRVLRRIGITDLGEIDSQYRIFKHQCESKGERNEAD